MDASGKKIKFLKFHIKVIPSICIHDGFQNVQLDDNRKNSLRYEDLSSSERFKGIMTFDVSLCEFIHRLDDLYIIPKSLQLDPISMRNILKDYNILNFYFNTDQNLY